MRRNVRVARSVIDECVPLEKWNRDNVKASLAQQTIAKERRAIGRKGSVSCYRMDSPEKVRRSVKLDGLIPYGLNIF